jgi:hypothetical protein
MSEQSNCSQMAVLTMLPIQLFSIVKLGCKRVEFERVRFSLNSVYIKLSRIKLVKRFELKNLVQARLVTV